MSSYTRDDPLPISSVSVVTPTGLQTGSGAVIPAVNGQHVVLQAVLTANGFLNIPKELEKPGNWFSFAYTNTAALLSAGAFTLTIRTLDSTQQTVAQFTNGSSSTTYAEFVYQGERWLLRHFRGNQYPLSVNDT